MANITKRVQKKLAEYLRGGESVQAALLVEPKGTYGLGAIATVVAPRTAGKVLDAQAAQRHADAGGTASQFPGRSCVIAKTDQRLLVSISNGLWFSAPVLELPLGGATITDHQKKLLSHRLTFTFSDGTAVIVDAQRGQPLDDFK